MKEDKKKKSLNEKFLIVLYVLLGLEVLFLPLLYVAEVKKALPIVMFMIIPTLLAIGIVFLSRNCFNSYEKKKNKIKEKLNV